jgi:hypothetical protein
MQNLTGDVTVAVAARMPKYLHPLSRRTIALMCERGIFKTAHKKGGGRTSQWFISASEIVQHKLNSHGSVRY